MLQARGTAKYDRIRDAEFRVFSQWGEDGIIQYLVGRTEIPQKTFIEFGVEDYGESNTRFLLLKDDWRGLVIDGSAENIQEIRSSPWAWRHALTSRQAFVDTANVNALFQAAGFVGDLGLLSIDVDGNDYWVWEAVNAVSPRIVVIEYNALWGGSRAVTVPYDPAFRRSEKHYSNLYFGASLTALVKLGARKGYRFVGVNSNSVNAFFIRDDVASDVATASIEREFEKHRLMQSRDQSGAFAFLSYEEERALVADLPLFDVDRNQTIRVADLEP